MQEDTSPSTIRIGVRTFDLIAAPQKVYVPMTGQGHGVLFSDPEEFIALMDEYVRPLVPRAN